MMYGFGDSPQPKSESVDLTEALVRRYVESLITQALGIQNLRGGKLDAECFLLAVSAQPTKFKRVKELLDMRENLKKARSITNLDDELVPIDLLDDETLQVDNNHDHKFIDGGSGDSTTARRKKRTREQSDAPPQNVSTSWC
mmetsp:Transcript_20317/g.26325  ORF Transcript_20317/g.26325 Transcript_20317/m.26325 type:complete len:142 (+) Transcript_20317:142-567(+)